MGWTSSNVGIGDLLANRFQVFWPLGTPMNFRSFMHNPTAALREFHQLTGKGSLLAMLELRRAYALGIGTSIDDLESEKWFKKSSRRCSVSLTHSPFLLPKDARSSFHQGSGHHMVPIRRLKRMFQLE